VHAIVISLRPCCAERTKPSSGECGASGRGLRRVLAAVRSNETRCRHGAYGPSEVRTKPAQHCAK
jgi:hypothetical protein